MGREKPAPQETRDKDRDGESQRTTGLGREMGQRRRKGEIERDQQAERQRAQARENPPSAQLSSAYSPKLETSVEFPLIIDIQSIPPQKQSLKWLFPNNPVATALVPAFISTC